MSWYDELPVDEDVNDIKLSTRALFEALLQEGGVSVLFALGGEDGHVVLRKWLTAWKESDQPG